MRVCASWCRLVVVLRPRSAAGVLQECAPCASRSDAGLQRMAATLEAAVQAATVQAFFENSEPALAHRCTAVTRSAASMQFSLVLMFDVCPRGGPTLYPTLYF